MHSQKQRHGEGSRYLPASTLENYGPYSEEICKLLLITDLKKKNISFGSEYPRT